MALFATVLDTAHQWPFSADRAFGIFWPVAPVNGVFGPSWFVRSLYCETTRKATGRCTKGLTHMGLTGGRIDDSWDRAETLEALLVLKDRG